ncbi:MAG: hypothetical protein KGL39_04550 [Patescibacteria group bacterium]|nr:hypothetical protein [Patescibacteria group bacterium]
MSGYSNWITAIGELVAGYTLVDPTSATPFNDDDFNTILPSAIQDAEGMMYRDPDLDFLQTRQPVSGASTVAGTRTLAIPSQILVLEQLVLSTPASSSPAAGTRVNASRVSLEFINAVYPNESYTQTPTYGELYHALYGTSAIIAPSPDGIYETEFYGVTAQTPLSAANPDTILTNLFPDLFNSASMIYLSGYMKNFAASGDAPQQTVSWQSHYTDLKKGAAFISARQKFLGAGSTAYPPAPQTQGAR